MDPFFQVRQFMADVNEHMRALVTPGPGIVLDESMIPLRGMTIAERVDGMPTKI